MAITILSVILNQLKNMEIARFGFNDRTNSNGFRKTKEKLTSTFGSEGWEVVYQTIFSTSGYSYIRINSNIRDAALAGSICRVNGGEQY